MRQIGHDIVHVDIMFMFMFLFNKIRTIAYNWESICYIKLLKNLGLGFYEICFQRKTNYNLNKERFIVLSLLFSSEDITLCLCQPFRLGWVSFTCVCGLKAGWFGLGCAFFLFWFLSMCGLLAWPSINLQGKFWERLTPFSNVLNCHAIMA